METVEDGMRAIKGGKCNNLETIEEETCSITSLSHIPQPPEELNEITEYVTFCVYHLCKQYYLLSGRTSSLGCGLHFACS